MNKALVLVLVTVSANAQMAGHYNTRNESHTNSKHFEELVINSDSTFSYFTRMEFIRITKTGRWSVNGDTLILNEDNPCCREKINVTEKYNKKYKKGVVRFSVTSFDESNIFYHLSLVGKDTLITLYSKTGITETRFHRLKRFSFIVNSLIETPEYSLKCRRSNSFIIKLAPTRFFYNEKWIINANNIIPLGWNGEYAAYYLKKEMP